MFQLIVNHTIGSVFVSLDDDGVLILVFLNYSSPISSIDSDGTVELKFVLKNFSHSAHLIINRKNVQSKYFILIPNSRSNGFFPVLKYRTARTNRVGPRSNDYRYRYLTQSSSRPRQWRSQDFSSGRAKHF